MAAQTSFEKRKLSGSTNGKMIKVVATATPGTTIHTATSTSGEMDEITLYAVNSDTSAIKLTVEFGGTTSPDDTIELTIPPESGFVKVVERLLVDGGVLVRAFACSANLVMIDGYVIRMS